VEGSGTVVELGPDLKIHHKVGDRVTVTGFGTWAEYALINSEYAVTIAPENSFEEAASSYVNPATVLTFIEQEVIKGGHKAVVHSAGASALGKILIRELKLRGGCSSRVLPLMKDVQSGSTKILQRGSLRVSVLDREY